MESSGHMWIVISSYEGYMTGMGYCGPVVALAGDLEACLPVVLQEPWLVGVKWVEELALLVVYLVLNLKQNSLTGKVVVSQ